MFELIGIILYGAFRAVVFMIKLFFKCLKYVTPIIIIVVAFFGSVALVSNVVSGKDVEWEYEQIQEVTHTVTIDWGDRQTTVTVREDAYWNINTGYVDYVEVDPYTGKPNYYKDPSVGYYLYQSGIVDSATLPSYAQKEGYKFVGLTELPWANSRMYVDANGNSLRTVTDDITLYAQWEEV